MTSSRNASTSVRQRLLNRSRSERRPFNELLQYFAMERFLYRLSQSTISAIENNRVQLGVERAKVLAQALQCHPAVLVFPGWEIKQNTAA